MRSSDGTATKTWGMAVILAALLTLRVAAELCDVRSSENVVIVDIMESHGPETDQVTRPEELPIEGNSEQISLSLLPDATNYFRLEGRRLMLVTPLDRDATDISSIVLRVSCQVRASGYRKTIPVIVRVTDINDHSPEFLQLPYRTRVPESVAVGEVIFGDMVATDRDAGINAMLEFSLLPGDGGATDGYGRFSINRPHQGVVTLSRPLDFETTNVYYLNVAVSDRAQPASVRRTATTTLTVEVEDSNDQPPGFVTSACRPAQKRCPVPTYRAAVTSREVSGVLDVRPERIHAVDGDTLGADIEYRAVLGQPANYHQYFEVDLRSGQVRQIAPVDRADVKQFIINVQARERNRQELFETAELIIDVNAVDTSPPVITITSPEGYVRENSPVGTKVTIQPQTRDVIRLKVDDPDWSPSEEPMHYRYELTTDSFTVDSDGYLVVARGDLDRDPPFPGQLTFQIVARETTGEAHRASLPVTVTVRLLDENDNSPQLPVYRGVRIAAGDGRRRIIQVHATDADEGPNADISYGVVHVSNNGRHKFEINSRSGDLDVLQRLYPGEQYSITVQAADRGGRQSQTIVEVAVVAGPNSAGPVFRQSLYDTAVSEGAGVGSTVLSVTAIDPENDPVTYSVEDGTGMNHFTISPTTGTISVSKPLDREDVSKFSLVVKAADPDGLSSAATVNIRVSDINDKNPQFLNEPYSFRTTEGEAGVFVGRVRAVDEDAAENSVVSYSVPSTSPFRIDAKTGDIHTRRPLDYENQGVYYLIVAAMDSAPDPRISTATATILVSDTEDEPPVFRDAVYRASVPENVPYAEVARVKAVDLDSRPSVHYVLRQGPRQLFSVNPETGLISTVRGLDFEENDRYMLIVGTDENQADSPDATATVIVSVEDKNDNPPVFTAVPRPVHLHDDTEPGTLVAALRATDADSTPPGNQIRYALTGTAGAMQYFAVDPDNGDIVLKEYLTDVNEPKFDLEITAFDLGTPELSSSVILPVFIESLGRQPIIPIEEDAGAAFADSEHTAELMENSKAESLVKTLTIINAPSGVAKLRCDIIRGNDAGRFSASARRSSCEVRVKSEPIDYEQQRRYVLVLRLGSPTATIDRQHHTARLTINILDRNDHSPEFVFDAPYSALAPGRFLAAVDREVQLGTHVIRIQARDMDGGQYGKMVYQIQRETDQMGYFDIDTESGIVSNAKTFRSVKPDMLPFNLTVVARDSSSTGEIMEARAHLLVNLIEPEHRLVLVISDAPPEKIKRLESKLVTVLQDHSGMVVGIERIDARHLVGENGTIVTDPLGTDVSFYVIDPRNDAILGRGGRTLNGAMVGERIKSQIAYYVSANLGVRAEDIRGPLPVTTIVTTRPVVYGKVLEGYQVALIVLGCLIALLSIFGIIYLCVLWRRYKKYRDHRPDGTIIVPKYEPYIVEPSLKEYETQVLQMSVPVDEDSVNDFTLDFSSEKNHFLNMDNISYITKDGNSSMGKDSGHATPSDQMRVPNYHADNRFDNKIVRSSSEDEVDHPAISATNQNVIFKERRDYNYLERSPVESTTEL